MLRAAAAAILLLATLAPAADAEWASFRGDSRNSATVAGSTYQLYQDVWWNNKTLGGAEIKTSPVIKGSTLIVTDAGAPGAKCPVAGAPYKAGTGALIGLVRALDVESGRQLWCTEMTGSILSTPAISGDHVYVADMKGVLRQIRLADGGVVLEDKSIGAKGTQAPIQIRENLMFVGTEDGRMRAFEVSTLRPIWTFSLLDYSPIYDPGTGTTPTPKCGEKFGEFPIRSGVASYKGVVYFGAMNNWFFALSEAPTGIGNPTQTGATIHWGFQSRNIIIGSPTVMILEDSAQTERVVTGSYDGTMYAFSTSQTIASPTDQAAMKPCTWTGARQTPTYENNPVTPVWKFEVPTVGVTQQVSRIHSSPASYKDVIYFGANNGHMYAVRATDGTKLWENATTGDIINPVTSSPIVANGIVMVGSENQNVYWIDSSNGKVLKSFRTQSAVQTTGAIDGARAFIASKDGTLYMFGPEIPKRPDLLVQSITGTSSGISIVVKNQGDAASAATTVRLFQGGTFLANVDVAAIEPGQSQTVTHTLALEGPTSIRALVDPDSQVTESVESNNERTQNVSPPAPDNGGDGGDGGGGGFKIPGPGLVPLLALLGLAALAMRRRR